MTFENRAPRSEIVSAGFLLRVQFLTLSYSMCTYTLYIPEDSSIPRTYNMLDETPIVVLSLMGVYNEAKCP